MDWLKSLFGPPPCKVCLPSDEVFGDRTLREKVENEFWTTDYIKALRKQDEENGIFIDPDCYLFAGDQNRISRSLISEYWLQSTTTFIFLATELMWRVSAARPLRSGIHRYPIAIALGWTVGNWSLYYKDNYCAERDAQLLHYCRLHPEDFPPPKRVLYRDYLAPWTPIR